MDSPWKSSSARWSRIMFMQPGRASDIVLWWLLIIVTHSTLGQRARDLGTQVLRLISARKSSWQQCHQHRLQGRKVSGEEPVVIAIERLHGKKWSTFCRCVRREAVHFEMVYGRRWGICSFGEDDCGQIIPLLWFWPRSNHSYGIDMIRLSWQRGECWCY